MCISLCATVVHSTAQSSSDNLPFYPPYDHHGSDVVYWREGVPLGISSTGIFQRPDVLPVTQPAVSNHWRKLKALTQTSGLASSVLRPPLDSWWKGHSSLYAGSPAPDAGQYMLTSCRLRGVMRCWFVCWFQHYIHCLLGFPTYFLCSLLIFMAALCNRGSLYFCPVVYFYLSSIFYLSFFSPRLISAATDWMSTILLHMAWPSCEFRIMQVWNVLHAARCKCKCRTQKSRQKSPSGHHPTTLSGYIFATKACIDNREKLIKQQYLPYMSPQYGELRPTSGWVRFVSLGHPR